MENETSMQEDAEQALSLEDSKRLLRHVYRVRENRRRILDRVPFLLRWGKWRKKKERQILADWTGGYVLINDRDYLYLPAGMDTMSTHYLIRPAESEPTVKNFCPPGGTVIDIGCNYGEWALQMARAVGRSGKVYAFEPVQRLADCAQKTMDVNGLGQTEIVTSAVSNRDGEARFAVNLDHSGKSGFGNSGTGDETEEISVPTVTLDSVVRDRNIDRLDFLKIDVEGHEADVLEGARETLRNLKPAIVLETGIDPDQDREKIHQILTSLDYRMLGLILPHGMAESDWESYRARKGAFATDFANVLFVAGKN